MNRINSVQYARIIKNAMRKNMRKAKMRADDIPFESVLIRGEHGIAKTAIPKSVAKEMGWKMISLEPASTPEAVDYMGQPTENPETGALRYIKPEFLPDPNSEVPHLIVLNDMNRANSEILNALMTLPEFQRVFIHMMPKNTLILATINPEGSGYSVKRMDKAQYTRWVFYDLEWDVKSFAAYHSSRTAVHPKIIEYVVSQAAAIKENTAGLTNSRTFTQLGSKINDELFSINEQYILNDAERLNRLGLDRFKKHIPNDIGSYIDMCRGEFISVANTDPAGLYDMLVNEDKTPGKFDDLFDGTVFRPEEWVADQFHYLFADSWCKSMIDVLSKSSKSTYEMVINTAGVNASNARFDDKEPTSAEVEHHLSLMFMGYAKSVANYRLVNHMDFIQYIVTEIDETRHIDYMSRCMIAMYPFMDMSEFNRIHDDNITNDTYVSIQNLFGFSTPGFQESEEMVNERNKSLIDSYELMSSGIFGTVGAAIKAPMISYIQKSEIMPNVHNMMLCIGDDGRKLTPEQSLTHHMGHLLADLDTIDRHTDDIYVTFVGAVSWVVKRIPTSTSEDITKYANVIANMFNMPMIEGDENLYAVPDMRMSFSADITRRLKSNKDVKSIEFKSTYIRAITPVYKNMNNQPYNARKKKRRSLR